MRITTGLRIVTAGDYTFQLSLGRVDTGEAKIDGQVAVELCHTRYDYDQSFSGAAVNVTSGLHQLEVGFNDDGGTFVDHGDWDTITMQYSGPDTGNVMIDVPVSAFGSYP